MIGHRVAGTLVAALAVMLTASAAASPQARGHTAMATRAGEATGYAGTDDATGYAGTDDATGTEDSALGNSGKVLLAAGDIASCESRGDEATARLLGKIRGTIASLGDTVYPHGSARDFAKCYDPSWGRYRKRTRPAVGNHEYHSRDAKPYFDYFGPAAGRLERGYYSYDLGAWHVVVLNSNCTIVSCAKGSTQERWLRADLAAHNRRCTLAYWHHPLFTSATAHPNAVETRPLFRALYDHKAEFVLAGHNHNYERFAPQNPWGAKDTRRGIRTFVVGTGGASHYSFGRIKPNSEVRNGNTYGVLKLYLRAGGYAWRFVPVAGKTFTDSGTGTCH